jgi:hypothetical protein
VVTDGITARVSFVYRVDSYDVAADVPLGAEPGRWPGPGSGHARAIWWRGFASGGPGCIRCRTDSADQAVEDARARGTHAVSQLSRP